MEAFYETNRDLTRSGQEIEIGADRLATRG